VSAGPALWHRLVLRSARSHDVVHRLPSAADQLRQYAENTPISPDRGGLLDPAMTGTTFRVMDDDTWIGVPGTLVLDPHAAPLAGSKITEHDLTALALTPLLPYGIEIFHAVRHTGE
jgi:hypothetical protein